MRTYVFSHAGNQLFRKAFTFNCKKTFHLACFPIFFILFFLVEAAAQTSNFSFTNKPWSDPEVNNWGRGTIFWNGTLWDNSQAPEIPAGSKTGKNSFRRFPWSDLEDHNGNYVLYGNYPRLEFYVKQSIDRGELIQFGGVMPLCSGCGLETGIVVDGSRMYYPKYIHDSMMKTSTPAWNNGSQWMPNWNNSYYLDRYQALMYAVADFFNTGSYVAKSGPWAGKKIYYKDVLDAVGIYGYGEYGEWHNWPYDDRIPANAQATSASLKRIIDAPVNAFPNTQTMILIGAFNQRPSSSVPVDVTYHALTRRNNYGLIGWRRDNIGDFGYGQMLESNPNSYNGMRFDTAIMNRWKYAMISGEPLNGSNTCCPYYVDIRRQTNLYHYSGYGNGNYVSRTQQVWDTIRSVIKISGYRYNLNGGSMSQNLSTGQPFTVSLNWRNVGVAPIYQKRWKVKYELKNSSEQVVQSWYSRFKIYLFLPSSVDSIITESFTLNNSVTPGNTYKLTVKLEDTIGVLEPIFLAVNSPSRNADGSYTLRSDISVSSGSTPNTPPTADAGADQFFSLPKNSTELNGKGLDAESGRLAFQWSYISGSSVPIIRTPGQSQTVIEGLKAGNYGFELKVTDSVGEFDLDTVFVFLNDPPRVSAGADQTLTLPDNILTLTASASDNDGSISTISWNQVGGPSGASIQTPGSLITRVEGLSEGEYLFSVSVTDDDAATASDTVFVKVNKQPNSAPIAVGGADIQLVLPSNNTQLNATSSSDPDGSVIRYTWSVISGPLQYEFGNATASSTSFYDLVQGKYIVQVTVQDNDGLTDSDTLQVVVYPDPNNIAPVADAGADVQITLPQDTLALNAAASYDPDGTISRFQWSKVEGPGQFSIQSGNAEKTIILDLVYGNYIFLLTITDNRGSTSVDSVKVTVLANPANQKPLANAGGIAVITLPQNEYELNATRSSDSDGFIIAYEWNQLTGPVNVLPVAVSADRYILRQLDRGIYRFSLKVMDNSGGIDLDTVVLTVNEPPSALASADVIMHFPENSVNVNGSGSNDVDGSIQKFRWQWLSGPAQFSIQDANSSATSIGNLVVGTYYFTLTVTDDMGGVDSDTLRIIVNEKPLANAGPDIVLTLPASITVLDGNGSEDKDGVIQSYQWSYVSGPASYKLINPLNPATILSELTHGVYAFSLKVTDQYGAEGSDTVFVTVNKAPNKLPVANAGADFSVYLPDPFIQLNGSGSYDPDGSIVSYRWRQVSGASVVNFNDTTTSFSVVSGVKAGSYTFQLTVKDNEGAIASTEVKVVVNEPVNKAPIARAGRDTTISLPYSRVTLNGGSSADPDGSIVLYSWRKLTGPAGPLLMNSGSAVAKVIDLVEGTYTFELMVKDEEGAASRDTVKVSVVDNMRTADFFQLSPNPAYDQIRLSYQLDATSTGKISIYNQLGHLMLSYPFSANSGPFRRDIPVLSLTPGMYILEMYIDNQKRKVGKFIKQ